MARCFSGTGVAATPLLALALLCRTAAASRELVRLHGLELARSNASKGLKLDDISLERRSCLAHYDLDSVVFPPETYSKKAIRTVAPGAPTVGDLHVVLDDVQLLKIGMTVTVEKKANGDISIAVTGADSAMAELEAWFDGLDFYLPQSKMDRVAKDIATVENWAAKIFTFGFAQEYGRVDRGPVKAQFSMSADIRYLGKGTGEWIVVPGTQKQMVDADFGSKGMLMGIANLVTKNGGTTDNMFAQHVWPQIMEIISLQLGTKLEGVDLDSFSHSFTVKGKCTAPSDGQCPNDQLKVDISATSSNVAQPEPLLREASRRMLEELPAVLDKLLKAYGRREDPLAGIYTSMAAHVKVKPSHEVSLALSPDVRLPAPFLDLALLDGKLAQFSPDTGHTVSSGVVSAEKGFVRVREMGVQRLTLPLFGEKMEFSGTIESFEVEEEGGGTGPTEYLFSKTSPLGVSAPGLKIDLEGKGGLAVEPQGKGAGALLVRVAGDFVRSLLPGLTASLQEPTSVRTAAEGKADGAVPPGLARPFPRMPAGLDLARTLNEASLDIKATIRSVKPQSATPSRKAQLVEAVLSATGSATLTLGSGFWQSIIDSKVNDWGYLDMTLHGTYGVMTGAEPPTTPAVLQLRCGIVQVYQVEKGTKPFVPDMERVLDLTSKDDVALVSTSKETKSPARRCVQIKPSMKFFCGEPDSMDKLAQAVALQVQRLEDAAEQWKATCTKDVQQNPKLMHQRWWCAKGPDGTWFEDFDPLNLTTFVPQRARPDSESGVKSPFSLWHESK